MPESASRGGVCSGGVSASRGVSTPGGVSAPRGVSAPGGSGVSAPGVYSQWGGGVCSRGVFAPGGLLPGGLLLEGIPACIEADTPSPCVNRITDTSKNITLATTSLRPVIKTSAGLPLCIYHYATQPLVNRRL